MKPRILLAVFGVAAVTAALAMVTATAAVTVAGPAGEARPAYPDLNRQLRYGSHGRDVKALQRRLAALKYYPGALTGNFSAYTLEALWAFQEVQGIRVSGVVDAATARALRHPRPYRARYARGGSARVEVNLRARVLVVYRHHAVALISHISAGGGYVFDRGARAVTPPGHYRTTAYLGGWIRVPLGAMYDPVFFIAAAYAIHGEPTYGPGGGGVPLNPVSHGCVRIPYDVARFFHRLVKSRGTPVYIYLRHQNEGLFHLPRSSAGHADPGAPQCLEQRLKLLVGRLVDRQGIVYAGLPQDDVAVPVLIGSGDGHGQQVHVEAPYRAAEDFKHAAIERDNAVRPGTHFEQVHDGEGTRTMRPRADAGAFTLSFPSVVRRIT